MKSVARFSRPDELHALLEQAHAVGARAVLAVFDDPIREALASRPLSPAWFSVRLMAWLGAAIASAAAVVTWANLRGFRAVLSAGAA